MLFFQEFYCRGPVSAEFGPKIFFYLSRPILSSFGQKYCLKKVFQFFKLFCDFFWNFLPGVEYERNSGLKFFSPFLGLSYPVLSKNNIRKRFFKFLEFFCYFFRNFLAGVQYQRYSSLKYFSPFPGLSHPILA